MICDIGLQKNELLMKFKVNHNRIVKKFINNIWLKASVWVPPGQRYVKGETYSGGTRVAVVCFIV